MQKTYGKLLIDKKTKEIQIRFCEPHVSIKIKQLFPKINKASKPPYTFAYTPETCADLMWLTSRYPMTTLTSDRQMLEEGQRMYTKNINELEKINLPDYKHGTTILANGFYARHYQLAGDATFQKVGRLLNGDDIGLGKTLTSILSLFNPRCLPAIVVVQTHLTRQWKEEGIELFTNLKAHIIKGTRPYDLPPADVYIVKYGCLSGWVDIFSTGLFKSLILDEVQELRRPESQKHQAAKSISESVEYCQGLSATPVYNFGDETFHILDLINPGCLGSLTNFLREYCTKYNGKNWLVDDPQALGSYLRERFLFLRRTRKEVGRELPPVNKIVFDIEWDSKTFEDAEELARALALRVVNGSFTDSGQASRELDMLARRITGVSKAKSIAAFVRVLLGNGEKVALAGWHRDVYDIWLRELEDFNPVMYTGSESPKAKEDALKAFKTDETNLFIISLRSGAGIDGLQKVCDTVVVGELDWSPKVHDQLIGRFDRGDDSERQVTAYFPIADSGSDPVIMNYLGLKASQSHGIINPFEAPGEQYRDESKMKALAQQFLNKKKHE